MESKDNILKEFYLLVDYLEKEKRIKNSEKYKNDFSAFLLHAQHIRTYDFVAPFCRGKKVLDIGCSIGYGEERIYFQSEKVVGIDNDISSLEFASKHRNFPNVKFERVDVTKKLPFWSESFDVVIAFHLIEHLPRERIIFFLNEVKRVLKPGGIFFVATPNRKFRLFFFQKPFNSEHCCEFTKEGFFKILNSIFDEVEIKGVAAKRWILEIEKIRVCKFRNPFLKFLNPFFPLRMKYQLKRFIKREKHNNEFNELFRKFRVEDFFLNEEVIHKSLTLLGICKKLK